ncbi:MAG: hypothetical protein VX730_03685 [Pseudomonadota bacterium]|nr:hypothetical protein [Pseudomonadota bacterium]
MSLEHFETAFHMATAGAMCGPIWLWNTYEDLKEYGERYNIDCIGRDYAQALEDAETSIAAELLLPAHKRRVINFYHHLLYLVYWDEDKTLGALMDNVKANNPAWRSTPEDKKAVNGYWKARKATYVRFMNAVKAFNELVDYDDDGEFERISPRQFL